MDKNEVLKELDEIGDEIVILRGALLELLDNIHELEKRIGGDDNG